MITRVRKYIRDNRMLKAEDMVVAGVSGGADSIAMRSEEHTSELQSH